MTKFERAFQRGTEGLEYFSAGSRCSHCRDCSEGSELWSPSRGYHDVDVEDGSETGCFMARACEACGSGPAGTRHAAHYVDSDGAICHLDVCIDCVMYSANGDVPDGLEPGDRVSCDLPHGINPPEYAEGTVVEHGSGADTWWIKLDDEYVESVGLSTVAVLEEHLTKEES